MGKIISGISVYLGLEDYPLSKTLDYLKEAKNLGITTVFTSLHMPEAKIDDDWQEFLKAIDELNLKLIIDISRPVFSPAVLPKNIYALRLDWGFTDEEIVKLTHELPCLIELNASTIDEERMTRLVGMGIKMEKVRVSFNFYPKPYTGMTIEDVARCTSCFHGYGISVLAYVPSHHGKRPPLYLGLPTVERHRQIPLEIAVTELAIVGIDEIVFGDAFASKEELLRLGSFDPSVINIPISLKEGITSEELEILRTLHRSRKDQSRYMIRSSITRGKIIKPKAPTAINTLDVTIDNERYLRYRGEVGIMLEPLPSNPAVNVVGTVKKEAEYIVKYLKPGSCFRCTWEE